jgi:hypothetical protein
MNSRPKIPRSVTIGGKVVKIRVVEGFEDWGEYDYDAQTITLSARCVASKEFIPTLRHEMTHAALWIGGVAFSEGMEEEALLRCLDTVFWPAWERVSKRLEK